MAIYDTTKYVNFFNPFCCRNRKIYYECITELIEKSKNIPVLYERDAKDILILYFRNCKYSVENDEPGGASDAGLSSSKSCSENASSVIKYFRQCGWLAERELGRNGDDIASVSPQCRMLMDAIRNIFSGNSNAKLTNHIFDIHDTLKSAFTEGTANPHIRTERPYLNILEPVLDHVSALENEILSLKDSIRTIMQTVIRMTETNDFGQFLLKDKVLEKFFSDYFFIKRNGTLPSYIGDIETMIRRLPSHTIYKKIKDDYIRSKNVSEEDAQADIDMAMARIQDYISYTYPKEMSYIDSRINSYYSLYVTRMSMVLNNNANLQGIINDLLISIKTVPKEERDKIFKKLSGCFNMQSYKYIGHSSIERRKKASPNRTKCIIIQDDMSDEEQENAANEIMNGRKDNCDINYAVEYWDEIMQGKNNFIPDGSYIGDKNDVIMMAAGIIHSGSADFPYVIVPADGRMESDVAVMDCICATRKNTGMEDQE